MGARFEMFSFDRALQELWRGKAVRRRRWPYGQYLVFDQVLRGGPSEDDGILVTSYAGSACTSTPWRPERSDLQARDWFVLPRRADHDRIADWTGVMEFAAEDPKTLAERNDLLHAENRTLKQTVRDLTDQLKRLYGG